MRISNRGWILLGASIGAMLIASIVFFSKSITNSPSPAPQSSVSVVPRNAVVAAVDGEHRFQVDLKAPSVPDIILGKMTLGSIHTLRIAVSWDKAVRTAAGSCSCLQVLSVPPSAGTAISSGKDDGESAMVVRYFAVRTGEVDVTLAFSGLDAAGKEQIQSVRLLGDIGPGDTTRASALEALLKTPLLISPQKDLTGVVPAATAVESVRAGRGLLVDIRPESEFVPHHAVPAIHVPFAQLGMNGFFASREVYLMGEPLVSDELLRARQRLLRQGKGNVFVVEGGVLAWQAAGGEVFQEIDEKLTAAEIEPAALFSGLGNDRVHVLAWNVSDEPAARFLLPGIEVTSAADWPQRAGEILEQQPAASLVLIDGDAAGQPDSAKLSPEWLGRVAWLRGGFAAYRAHVSQLSAIAASQPGSTQSSLRPLANTGPFEGMAPRRGGCGTCPK